MKVFFSYIICIFSIVTFFTACSNTKKLPAGESLYIGSSIKVDDSTLSKKQKKSVSGMVSGLTRPRPNKKVLGMRFKLAMYNLAGNPKKENSPAGWLKNKVGEPPVLLSSVNLDHNIKVLQSTLENKGYFHAVVSGDTTVKNRKAQAIYTVRPGPRYTIDTIAFDQDTTPLQKEINAVAGATLLKKDKPFDLATIRTERDRIDDHLKETGFFFFDPDYLVIRADSTIGTHKVNLFVKVKPNTPPEAREIYRINDVYIYPRFRLGSTQAADTSKQGATFYKGYNVVDRRHFYKPRMFDEAMRFDPGDVYNRTDHNMSISRLVNLGVFRFVKNRFEVVKGTDSAQLNAYYYLTPAPKKSIRAEINASTKSNNLTGSSLTVGWRNRNTFRGGELFSIDATGGFEVQFSGNFRGFNTYRGGIEAKLAIPRFIVPIFRFNTNSSYTPRTNILLGYDLLIRQKLYTLNSFRAGFGYSWKESLEKEHQFNPIEITYVQPINVSQLYADSAENNRVLLKAIERQFILGTNYNFNYNQLQEGRKHGFYFNGNIDLSGNIAGLVSGADAKNNQQRFIANAPFAQYVKAETDFRYYFKLDEAANKILANRLILGFGLPYGNSTSIPFIKQFFIGGTNSIRAFRTRALGPGTYRDSSNSPFLVDQSGDIKIELNTELRAKLFSIVHGAIFLDAGNIWLYNTDTLRSGARFSKNFLNEFAVGGGVGLRFDISFLVLRLDLAVPLRKPWLPDGDRWVIRDFDFKSKEWRRENLIFNLGIGYPF